MSMTQLKSGRARLLCSTGLVVAGALLASSAAYAQEAVETVVITGSRIAVTSAFDAPTPVSVVSAEEIHLSGTVNMEALLNQSPQFVPSTNGGQTSNAIQGNGDSGAAWLNLRGLGEIRNLVLVNGRRFAIQGTRMTTDINTIPAALIERTEVVTGGNSAVYGSDAISGVVNFVMKKNFEGVEGNAQYTFDQFTTSPIYNFDLTIGGNFDHDKGNIVMAVGYMSRKGFTNPEHGAWLSVPLADGCVTAASYTPSGAGTYLNSTSGAACITSGGVNGMYASGSNDTYNGYINQIGTYAGANATLQGYLAAAGLTNMTSDGMIFTNTGSATPGTIRNRNTNGDLYTADKFNTIATNYMQVPQQRWMINTFAHYTFDPKLEGYAEFHFSSNTVSAQLTPSNANGFMLFNTHDPMFPAALQTVFDYMDSQETGTSINPACFTVGPTTNSVCTYQNDGKVKLGWGKRVLENGKRRQDATRTAWRFAGGFRGDLGSVDPSFLKDISYDVYYTFAHTNEIDRQSGSFSRSRLQQNVLASTNGGTPVCELFGIGSMSAACISAITVNSTVFTQAEMQDLNASVTGTAFDLPAGPLQFAMGAEWRYQMAEYVPDQATRTGDVAGLNSVGATPKGAVIAHEVYGEVKIPILADLPMIQKLTVNGAFRYSDYNLASAHNIWTWSLGGDWKVMSDLSFRGQFQHAIRAPNAGELWGGFQSNSALLVDPCGFSSTYKAGARAAAVSAICVAQGVTLANVFTNAVQAPSDYLAYTTGGTPTLKPEISDTITLGVVVTPEAIPGLAASIDFYSINIKDMISPLGGGVTGVLSNCYNQDDPNNFYCQQISRVSGLLTAGAGGNVNAANGNISGVKTQGFDFGGQYSFGVDWGLLSNESTIDVGSNWNWVLELVSLPDATAPTVKSNCAGAYGNTYCYQEPSPRAKGTSRITWNDGPVSISLKWRYIDGVTLDKYLIPLRRGTTGLLMANFTRPQLPNMNYFDVSASWDITETINIYGGINNLFSKDPPVVGGAANTYPNSFPGTYDSLGRVTFIGIKAKTN
jgi:iron complex outermembrane recepter protein